MGAVSRLNASRRTAAAPPLVLDALGSDDADEGIVWRSSHLKALSNAIEGEIIPRLLLAHGDAATSVRAPTAARTVTEADVNRFADLLLTASTLRCIAFAERLVADGVPTQAMLLDLFAPAARVLGTFWTEDTRSFTDVTIALGGLQQVLRHFSSALDAEAGPVGPRKALLLPAPGEQHTFGLFMVEMFLHRAGWEVEALPVFDAADVRDHLRHTPVDLVGVSCSCDRFVDQMRDAVTFVRAFARDDVPVMGGGQVFLEAPQLAGNVGVDAVATNAFEAVDAAARLVPLPADRRRRLS